MKRGRLVILYLLVFWFSFSEIVFSQSSKPQPLIIYCGVARPPVYKSSEPIRLTYCLKYLKKAPDGRELRIITDLKKVEFGKFEVDPDPKIETYKSSGNEIHLRLTYTLRRIDHKKSQDTIPPFVIQYAIERPGGDKTNQQIAKSEPIVVRYVSTVTDERPDIRDGVDFGGFKIKSFVFLGIAVLMVLLALINVFREIFFRKISKDESVLVLEKNKEDGPEPRKRLKVHVARRILLEKLITWSRKLSSSEEPLNFEDSLKLESELHESIRDLFLAEVPKLNWGNTANYIIGVLRKERGRRGEILVSLAYVFFSLDSDIQIGYPSFISGSKDRSRTIESQRSSLKEIKRLCIGLEWAAWVDFIRFFKFKRV